jgi:hypothetical protein
MSTQEKLYEQSQHIRDVDAKLDEVEEHIKAARQHEAEVLHPAPGIDLVPPRKERTSPGQFGG